MMSSSTTCSTRPHRHRFLPELQSLHSPNQSNLEGQLAPVQTKQNNGKTQKLKIFNEDQQTPLHTGLNSKKRTTFSLKINKLIVINLFQYLAKKIGSTYLVSQFSEHNHVKLKSKAVANSGF